MQTFPCQLLLDGNVLASSQCTSSVRTVLGFNFLVMKGPSACSFGHRSWAFWCPDAVSSSPVCDSAVDRVASLLVFINHSNPEAHPWSAVPAWTKLSVEIRSKTTSVQRCPKGSRHSAARCRFASNTSFAQNRWNRIHVLLHVPLAQRTNCQRIRHLTWNKITTHSGQQAIRVKWKNES